MTDLNIAIDQNRKAGVKRMKKHSLKTDMTPMVDLGFLLITFFVFTAEITKPVAMNLYMPHDGKAIPAGESKSMTILSGKDNELFFYYGREEDAQKNKMIFLSSYDEKNGIGNIIRQKQYSLEQKGINKSELTVLIKAGDKSSYKNVVDILDEMTINNVTRYALVRPSIWEGEYINKGK